MPVLPLEWGGRKSTRYKAMCEFPADASQDELELRIRAFHDDFYAIFPTITLHGIPFHAAAAPVPMRSKSTSRSRQIGFNRKLHCALSTTLRPWPRARARPTAR